MTKRIASLLAATLIPIALIFTGCGKRLTEREYFDELYATFKQYSSDMRNIGSLQTNVSVSELKGQLDRAKELCKTAEKTLDGFMKMNPPSQFDDKHKKLTSAVKLEKDFLKATEKIFTATSEEELSKYTKEAEAVFDGIPEEQQFAAVFLELFLEVKDAVGA